MRSEIMPSCFKTAAGALLAILITSGAFADQISTLSQKAALQAAMQKHIERGLVDGAYLHFDLSSGVVRELAQVKAHPVILMMGEYFVLCSDFRDKAGKAVNIDYYLARRGKSYVVFHSEVDNRDQLMALIQKGKVTHLK
jgi:hypothetical protein